MESLWAKTCEIEKRPSLPGDRKTEIAVIGAGMAGILIAYELQKAGRQVILLEANRIAGGQTQNTTAKITSQHGLIYADFIHKYGESKARQYAMANERAIRAYEELIEREHIVCDFEKLSSYVYSKTPDKLNEEAEAAAKLGLPASMERSLQLPFPVWGAVKFEQQAQFHPLKFIKALSQKLEIYEHTAVKKVDENQIFTDYGTVTAEHIVFACHYPFLNIPGLYFTRMHQERSYVLALENAGQVNGMFIGNGKNGYSLRNYGPYLFFGGEGHRCGKNPKGQNYETLRQEAKKLFPESREVCCWSAQDCMTPDKIPYIGSYSKGKPNWYVATGFQKWGMTSSMISAMILKEQICHGQTTYDIFSPSRFPAENISGILCETGYAAQGLTKRVFASPKTSVDELLPGHGGIVTIEGQKAGVYKDESNHIFIVNIRCPHLGCELQWNPAELTWDCPCHGSRFDYKGNLINNPAQTNISGTTSENK